MAVRKETTDTSLRETVVERDTNPDPITGAPGAHPVGTGLGAAAGGAAIAGAAIGMGAGPVGAAVGAALGAVVGGLAGKGMAEQVDPTVEEVYWRENYRTRPYYDESVTYDEYAPAYRYGWESRSRYADRSWDEAETDLGRDWEQVKDRGKLKWDRAKLAARDAWHRVERNLPGDADGDGR